jgi:hypothetical protein
MFWSEAFEPPVGWTKATLQKAQAFIAFPRLDD